MMTNKSFDAVKMMRDIRSKHHDEYENNPDLREQRLAEIRKKYKARFKNNRAVSI